VKLVKDANFITPMAMAPMHLLGKQLRRPIFAAEFHKQDGEPSRR
jgi:hypothetical protein